MIVLDYNDNEIETDAVYDWWIVALVVGILAMREFSDETPY